MSSIPEFSYQTRADALRRFRSGEVFDLLIIGGGISGAGAARDAALRGLKVALVEKGDFASGTSSRSSKLIHGGLRYLENFEFRLVFEALSERARLLKTVQTLVRPLPFYLPVYSEDPHGSAILDLGLWLYDLLALFRTPGFHKRLSRKKMLKLLPFLRSEGLKGGFRYFDASMWDDVLTVETLRSAAAAGAAVANYCEATVPIWDGDRITGYWLSDRELPPAQAGLEIRAHRVMICAGPWTDLVGRELARSAEEENQGWKPWLSPSKGVHILFDLKRIPVSGAMVMSHPADGRISFVIPRPDFGSGVVIVGTTDSPSPEQPEKAEVTKADVDYLMALLRRYFPDLYLTTSDILSAYVGVRPLVGGAQPDTGAAAALQKVSREHQIGTGPGGTVIVAGGKYTTYRKMAEEAVDFAIWAWRKDAANGKAPRVPKVGPCRTKEPLNPALTKKVFKAARTTAEEKKLEIPPQIWERYGAEAIGLVQEFDGALAKNPEVEGFPFVAAQLRHAIRHEMVMHLEDFYLRRLPLFAARKDHALPWAEELSRIWASERGLSDSDAHKDLSELQAEIQRRESWRAQLQNN